jgi:hypothetical protein
VRKLAQGKEVLGIIIFVADFSPDKFASTILQIKVSRVDAYFVKYLRTCGRKKASNRLENFQNLLDAL